MSRSMALDLADLELAEVGTWPAAVRGLCFLGIAAVALGVAYLLAVSDKRAELTRGERREAELALELTDRRGLAAAVAKQRTALDTATRALADGLARLPSDIEVPGLVEDITHAALDNDLVIERIDLAEERLAGFYRELPIAIVVGGDFHDLGAFTADIASLPRLVTLHDFELAPRSGPRDLGLTIEARTYRYAPDPSQPRLVEDPGGSRSDAAPTLLPGRNETFQYGAMAGRSPFEPLAEVGATRPADAPDPERAPGPLEVFPLGQLQMVGTLARGGRFHALVRDPHGITHLLAVGDYLGRDHGRIMAVRDTGIDIVELIDADRGSWSARHRILDMGDPGGPSDPPRHSEKNHVSGDVDQ